MKNLKTKTIVLASLIFTFGMFAVSEAAGVYLEASPGVLVKNVDASFTVSARLITDSNVYAVEGTVVFNNLTCKSIVVENGLVAQSAPTCSNPYFLIGIPNGTNVDKTLFQVVVSGNSVGDASIGFLNVDIIGAGNSLSNVSLSGIYEITAVPKVFPFNVPSTTPVISTSTNSSTTPAVIATSSDVLALVDNTNDKGNRFVATVLETLSNVRESTRFAVSAILVLIVLGVGPLFLRKIEDRV